MEDPCTQTEAHGKSAGVPSADPEVEALFRKLLQQMHVESVAVQPDPAKESREEVVLRGSVDGLHYTLSVSHGPAGPEQQLSAREREISRLVAKGLCNKEIAAVLEISSWTVATHVRRIFAKLGVSSRAEMVAKTIGGGRIS